MNFYYKLWNQAITRENKARGEKYGKDYALLIIVCCQGLNLLTLIFALKAFFGVNIGIFIYDISSSKILNGMFSVLFQAFIPLGLLNYFFVLRSKNFRSYLKSYEPRNYILYFGYVIFSFSVLILPILIGYVISRI